jgi:hypothetical protein
MRIVRLHSESCDVFAGRGTCEEVIVGSCTGGMVGDMMRRETVACGWGLAAGSVWNAYVTQCMCELRRYAEVERTGMDSCAAVVV